MLSTTAFEKDIIPMYVASIRYHLATKHSKVGTFTVVHEPTKGMVWMGFKIKSEYSDELC